MLDTFGFPTPQGANYQEFYGGGTVRDWVKPRGASMARILLIGAGAGGRSGATTTGGRGGGSGAVTQWIGPAIFIPDVLRISIGAGGASDAGGGATLIIYQAKDATGYTLLTANGAINDNAGAASTNNYFGAAGIFKSIAGQSAPSSGSVLASTTTFLSAGSTGNGSGGSSGDVNCNYGYPQILGGQSFRIKGGDGFFITQPIMVGAGGAGGGTPSGNNVGGIGGTGGIGCGGGGGGSGSNGFAGGAGGRGGDGAVFIWSW